MHEDYYKAKGYKRAIICVGDKLLITRTYILGSMVVSYANRWNPLLWGVLLINLLTVPFICLFTTDKIQDYFSLYLNCILGREL